VSALAEKLGFLRLHALESVAPAFPLFPCEIPMSRCWLTAVLLVLVCGAGNAAEVRVRVHQLGTAPARLWVAAPADIADVSKWQMLTGRAHQGRRPMIPPPVDDYAAELAAGEYMVAGYSKAGFVLPGAPEVPLPLRALREHGEAFAVPASGTIDLGELELFADGSLAIMIRIGAANPAWALADADSGGDPLVTALRSRVRSVNLSETPDGGWLALASGHRLARLDADRAWRVYGLSEVNHPQVAAFAGSDAIVVAGYGPQLAWLAADGAVTTLPVDGLPAGAAVLLQCDAQARCALAIRGLDNRSTLAWTADARSQPWKRASELPSESCGWATNAECSMPAQFHAFEGRVLAVSDGTRLSSLDLASGEVSEKTLEDEGRGSVYRDGNLIVGKRVSRDGGQTWSRRAKEDDRAQTAVDGKRYMFEVDAGLRFALPIIRRQESAGARWQDHAVLPAFGNYVVGRNSPRQYLGTPDGLWLSTDAGQSWRGDHDLVSALTALRSSP